MTDKARRLNSQEAQQIVRQVIASGRTAEELANECGVTTGAVTHWLAGDNGMWAQNHAVCLRLLETAEDESSQYLVTGTFFVTAATVNAALTLISEIDISWSKVEIELPN